MKSYTKIVVEYDDYTTKEIYALSKEYWSGSSELSDDMAEKIRLVMNILQKVYGTEGQDIEDKVLFKQALIFSYHLKELCSALSSVVLLQ